ncbi:hypothetical protein E2C01_081757 [Portunus trituberculatus]|uniref:Uncharacterized protein n=1 Tax=Portunus trituberculatus TaxID=210409 RepID=A0A5B7J1Z6_PORTR|nr:hypothetical protein [Portunus trituberculatus]
MKRKRSCVDAFLHQPLDPDLSLLRLAKGCRGQDLVDDPRALRVGEVLIWIVAAQEPEGEPRDHVLEDRLHDTLAGTIKFK